MNKAYTIGRDTQCDIVINDQTDVISRVHAVLRIRGRKKMTITDQSCNGTYINGIRIASNVEVPITRKDVISFAHIRELDWSELPGTSGGGSKYVLISALSFFILAGVGYGIYRQLNRPAVPALSEENPHATLPAQKDTVIRTDTVMKRDTVFIEPPSKKEVQPEKAAADSVKEPEKQKENEVVNPVY